MDPMIEYYIVRLWESIKMYNYTDCLLEGKKLSDYSFDEFKQLKFDEFKQLKRTINNKYHPDKNGGKNNEGLSIINGQFADLEAELKKTNTKSNIGQQNDYESEFRTNVKNTINRFKTYDDYDVLKNLINVIIDDFIRNHINQNDIKLTVVDIERQLTPVIKEIFYNYFNDKFNGIVGRYELYNGYEKVQNSIISKKEELFAEFQKNYKGFNNYAIKLEEYINEMFNIYSQIITKLQVIQGRLDNLVNDYFNNEDFNELFRLYRHFSGQEYFSKDILTQIEDLDSKIDAFLFRSGKNEKFNTAWLQLVDKYSSLYKDYKKIDAIDFDKMNKLWELIRTAVSDVLSGKLSVDDTCDVFSKIDFKDYEGSTNMIGNIKKSTQRTNSMIYYNPHDPLGALYYLEPCNDGLMLIKINRHGRVEEEKSISYDDLYKNYISLESILENESSHFVNLSYEDHDYIDSKFKLCYTTNVFSSGYLGKAYGNRRSVCIFYRSYESFSDKNSGFFYFGDYPSRYEREFKVNYRIDYRDDEDFSRLIDDIVSSTKRIINSHRAEKANEKRAKQ